MGCAVSAPVKAVWVVAKEGETRGPETRVVVADASKPLESLRARLHKLMNKSLDGSPWQFTTHDGVPVDPEHKLTIAQAAGKYGTHWMFQPHGTQVIAVTPASAATAAAGGAGGAGGGAGAAAPRDPDEPLFQDNQKVSFTIDADHEWPAKHHGVFPGVIAHHAGRDKRTREHRYKLGCTKKKMQQLRKMLADAGLLKVDSEFSAEINTGQICIFVGESKVSAGWEAAERYWAEQAQAAKRSAKVYEVGEVCSFKPSWTGRWYVCTVVAANKASHTYTLRITNGNQVGHVEKGVHSKFMDKGDTKGAELERAAKAQDDAIKAQTEKMRAAAAKEQAEWEAKVASIKESTLASFKAANPGVEPKFWDSRRCGGPAWVTPQEYDRRQAQFAAIMERERAEREADRARYAAEAAEFERERARDNATEARASAAREAARARTRDEQRISAQRAACTWHIGKPPSAFRATGGKCPRCEGQIFGGTGK